MLRHDGHRRGLAKAERQRRLTPADARPPKELAEAACKRERERK